MQKKKNPGRGQILFHETVWASYRSDIIKMLHGGIFLRRIIFIHTVELHRLGEFKAPFTQPVQYCWTQIFDYTDIWVVG